MIARDCIDGLTYRTNMDQAVIDHLLEKAIELYPIDGTRGAPIQAQGWLTYGLEWLVKSLFKVELDMNVKRWEWQVTCNKPGGPVSEDGEWVQTFPHKHGWDRTVTMSMWLQAPEGGGELVLKPEGREDVVIVPEPGLCAFMSGDVLHGVRPVTGSVNRIGLLVTGHE